jgi:hypothetical protein
MSLPHAGHSEVEFSSALPSLSPALSEDAFLKNVPTGSTAVVISNPPYATYRFIESVELDGMPMLLHVSFERGVLRHVSVSVSPEGSGRDWSDWSEAGEMRKKVLHDTILAKAYGSPPYNFSWGTISSSYDPRGGSSSIAIRYA